MKENDDLQAKISTLARKLEGIKMQKVNVVTTVPKCLWYLRDLGWKTHASFVMTPLI